jgi:DNA-binding MarR family transcriptional regulator
LSDASRTNLRIDGLAMPAAAVLLLTWTTIPVNTDVNNNIVARRLPDPEWPVQRRDEMTVERRGVTRALPFRRASPTRRGARPPIALDALNEHLGYFVRRLQVWIFQDFIRTLKRIDISPAQFSVLVVINANRGLSQAELAATLGVERARLARLLNRLEGRALIQRLKSFADGRRHALQLTASGRAVLTRAKTMAARHERRLTQKLGRDRHRLLLEALQDF